VLVDNVMLVLQETLDESHWHKLKQSLFRVSSLMNGKKDTIREIEVGRIQSNCLLTKIFLSFVCILYKWSDPCWRELRARDCPFSFVNCPYITFLGCGARRAIMR
jgi:hypothetical protein